MKINKLLIITSLTLTLLSGCSQVKQEAPAANNDKIITQRTTTTQKSNTNVTTNEDQKQVNFEKPFPYQHKKIFKMLNLDFLGRAQGSHIQLSENQTPEKKRSPYLTIRPSGWHNYKFYVNGKPTWFFNRGHLVGYQFCGIDQAPGNMITQTQYLNQGGTTHMDDQNTKGQLYYENKLRTWLINHPSDKLDYSVIPLYRSNELVPRGVKLTYTGYNENGQNISVDVNSPYVKKDKNINSVILENTSPLAKIDYQTGRIIK